jgi:hypothetical protein
MSQEGNPQKIENTRVLKVCGVLVSHVELLLVDFTLLSTAITERSMDLRSFWTVYIHAIHGPQGMDIGWIANHLIYCMECRGFISNNTAILAVTEASREHFSNLDEQRII